MIKPAVEAAGLKCVRADEIVHSGLIDVPMYEQLLNAEVVVADVSTSKQTSYQPINVVRGPGHLGRYAANSRGVYANS